MTRHERILRAMEPFKGLPDEARIRAYLVRGQSVPLSLASIERISERMRELSSLVLQNAMMVMDLAQQESQLLAEQESNEGTHEQS